MTKWNIVLLLRSDPQCLANDLLPGFLKVTATILGKKDLKVHHLRYLTRLKPDYPDSGAYLHTAMRPVGPDESSEWATVHASGQVQEAGIYVGSSHRTTRARPLVCRNDEHRRIFSEGVPTKNIGHTRHYRFIPRQGVRYHISVLGRWCPTDTKANPMSRLAEALAMIYLNTVVGEASWYHSEACVQYLRDVRAAVPELPDFQEFGLNMVWNFEQETVKVPRAILDQPCSVPGCRANRTYGLANPGDPFGPRLCATHVLLRLRQHPKWISLGPCIHCRRPRDMWQFHFTGRGETSVCRACLRHMEKQFTNKGLPTPTVEESSHTFGGCANCHLKEWWTHDVITVSWGSGKTRSRPVAMFKGYGPNRRCAPCHWYKKIHLAERPKEDW